jgi:prevent-host-death family protein
MIGASEFKAKCLAILDDVAETGEPIVILKRGKPVAELVRPLPREATSPQAALVGSVRISGNVRKPVLPADAWAAERGEIDGGPSSTPTSSCGGWPATDASAAGSGGSSTRRARILR